MSSETDPNPFRRKVMTRQPGLIGAQWWNEGLSAMTDPVSRRKALQALAMFGGVVTVGGLVLAATDDDEYLEFHDALQMQRERGWNFGATDDTLSFSGQANVRLEPQALRELATELAPKQDALKPFYQATLFQALSASGTLLYELRPIFTPAMDTAFNQGSALADLFARQEEAALATAVLVDLPGPESVAFAAGLAGRFEPVFTHDNWPHPVGVVPAHLTLAAVAYYQPVFRQLAQKRQLPAPPLFVLDRQRLAPYTDQQTQFDNRYMARMPTAEQLRKLGLQHVLYVVPGGSTPAQELDDLNEDFVAWRAAGLDVKLVAASDFQPDSTGTATSTSSGTSHRAWYYGGSPVAHDSFWFVYPWGHPRPSTGTMHGLSSAGILSTAALARVPSNVSGGYAYEPMRRATMFSAIPRGATGAFRPFPSDFGKVAMRMSSQSRSILGPAFSSRSSWSRSSSYSSSGG
jgi:hypothetical protein